MCHLSAAYGPHDVVRNVGLREVIESSSHTARVAGLGLMPACLSQALGFPSYSVALCWTQHWVLGGSLAGLPPSAHCGGPWQAGSECLPHSPPLGVPWGAQNTVLSSGSPKDTQLA